MTTHELDIVSAAWPAPAGIHALTTTRNGGFSSGPYASFNPATHVGDNTQAVARNQQLLTSVLDLPGPLHWLQQVHGNTVVAAEHVDAKTPVQADGVVTGSSDTLCAILTADCLPLFLCDRGGTRIGLLHVGWRGLAAGIVESGVRALAVGRTDILAWMGPAIGPHAFEVGEDVYTALASDSVAAAAFKPLPERGKWHADLYRLVEYRLQQLAVDAIFCDRALCTYTQPERFFSYRRDGRCGRMASLIWRSG